MGARCLKLFDGKTRGKKTTWKTWHMCDIDIIMDIQAVGWGGMDWMDLNQVRNGCRGVVKVVMNLLVPNSAWNFVTK